MCFASTVMDTEDLYMQDSGSSQLPRCRLGELSLTHISPTLRYQADGCGMPQADSVCDVPMSVPFATPNTWHNMVVTQPPHPLPDGSELPVPIPPTALSVSNNPSQPRRQHKLFARPRRTLTVHDRRRICLYHEEHKTAKQVDIAGQLPHQSRRVVVNSIN